MKRSPMPKRRTTPRRTTSPRCSSQRCKKRAEVLGLCISHAEQRADRLFSRYVRDRDGRCTGAAVLGGDCNGILNAAHGVGRRNYTLRYSPENVWALCSKHHMVVDQHGQEHAKYQWLTHVLGRIGYELLMTEACIITKRRTAVEDYLEGRHRAGGEFGAVQPAAVPDDAPGDSQ